MRALVFFDDPWQAARNDSLVNELATRGHEVTLAFARRRLPALQDADQVVSAVCTGGVEDVALRLGAGAPSSGGVGRVRFGGLRRGARMSRELTPDSVLVEDVRAVGPEVVLLAGAGRPRDRVALAARTLGVPVVAHPAAWTAMSAKLAGESADLVCAWNDAQARPSGPTRSVVTGATGFGRLGAAEPSPDREAFCARHGLDPDRSFHLVVIEAPQAIGPGLEEITDLARTLRRRGAVQQLLIRAHDTEKPKPLLTAPRPPADLDGVLSWATHPPGGGPNALRWDYRLALEHALGVISDREDALLDAALLDRAAHDPTNGTPALERPTGGAVRGMLPDGGLPRCAARVAGRPLLALTGTGGDEDPAAAIATALEVLAAARNRAAPPRSSLRSPAKAARRPPARQPLPSFSGRSDAELALVRHELLEAVAGDEPVLAGPFSAEVGFELLYWIPFLRWATTVVPGLSERLIVVSRGGTASWSADIASGYAELFEVTTPTEMFERRTSQKQREVSAFDEELMGRVREQLGLERIRLLHPSIFFRFYYRTMKLDQRTFVRYVRPGDDGPEGFAARYRPLTPPDAAGLDLPEDFVAVRFYSRPSLPDDEDNRSFIAAILGRIASSYPVVLLNNGLELDDHVDFDVPEGRVRALAGTMSLIDNLRVQTAVIARARAFVGTYGGLAYLAPHCGVPSVAFSSVPARTHAFHLDLAQRIFDDPRFGAIVSLKPEDLDLLTLVTGASALR